MITAMPRIAIAVRDFQAAIRTFQDILGMPVVDLSRQTVPNLGAHVAMCVPEGGSNIEIMAAADPAAPLEPESLEVSRSTRRRSLRPDAGSAGSQRRSRGHPFSRTWCTPSDGRCQRSRYPPAVDPRRSSSGCIPDNSFQEPAPRGENGVGLSGITRVLIATRDLPQAAQVYGHGLGLAVEPPATDDERGVSSVTCRAPQGGSIELVTPSQSERPFAQQVEGFLNDHGDGMYGARSSNGRHLGHGDRTQGARSQLQPDHGARSQSPLKP